MCGAELLVPMTVRWLPKASGCAVKDSRLRHAASGSSKLQSHFYWQVSHFPEMVIRLQQSAVHTRWCAQNKLKLWSGILQHHYMRPITRHL